MAAQAAIVGLGITEMTRTPIGDNPTLAARAIKLALDDAGLQTAIERWRQDRPDAPLGDCPGRPYPRPLGGYRP